MDNRGTAAIVSIGAVMFTGKGLEDEFYKNIELSSCAEYGLTLNADTIYWWLQQTPEAQQSLIKNREGLVDVLRQFSLWLSAFKLSGVWGNGSDFDNAILAYAYKQIDVKLPWKYYMNRCFRTVRKHHHTVKIERTNYHNALADARWQAEYLVALCEQGDIKL